MKTVSALLMGALAFNTYANFATDDLVEQAKILRKGNQHIDQDWLKRATEGARLVRGEALDLAENVVTEQTKEQAAAEDKQRMESFRFLVFVSYSLNEASLDEILRTIAGREDTAVVFRGVPNNMKIDEGMRKVQQLAMKIKPVPNIILNPELFTKHNVSVVPTVVMRSDEKPQNSVLSVKGIFDPSWLEKRFEHGEEGDLGVKGPIELIAERDLIEVMKERVAQVDWKAKKEAALKRFWSNQKFIDLPVAVKDSVRRIDPTVVVTSDIRTSAGEFVAKEGDRVNPLDTRPFTQAYIVFDPLDKRQVKRAKALAGELKPTVAAINYLVTQFDRDDGWASYEAISDELDAPVYLLTNDVQERFQVEKVPSVITADTTHFIISEKSIQKEDPSDE